MWLPGTSITFFFRKNGSLFLIKTAKTRPETQSRSQNTLSGRVFAKFLIKKKERPVMEDIYFFFISLNFNINIKLIRNESKKEM